MNEFFEKQRGNRTFWAVLLICFALIAYCFQPIRIFEDPYKVGEVTFFSMLILCLVGYCCGPIWGFVSCFLFGGITFAADVLLGFSPFSFSECLDYLLGYSLMGICGVLASRSPKRSLLFCFSWAVALRFVESVWIWSFFREVHVSLLNDFYYGVKNCIGYIGFEYVLSLILLLLPQTKEVVEYIDNRVINEEAPDTENYDYF